MAASSSAILLASSSAFCAAASASGKAKFRSAKGKINTASAFSKAGETAAAKKAAEKAASKKRHKDALSNAKAKLTPNQQEFLRHIFNSYDKNGDDKLNELEIMSAFFAGKVSGMAKGESLKLIKQNSVDGNDTLNFDEFLVWCETTNIFSIDQWKNAFDRWMKKNNKEKVGAKKSKKRKCKEIPKAQCKYLQNLSNPENLHLKDKIKLECCKEKPKTGGRRKSRRKTRRRKSRRRKSRRRKSRRKYSRSRKRKKSK